MNKKSIVSSFLRLRREIRLWQDLIDVRGDTMTTLLRAARRLEAGTPFDQARATVYRARHEGIKPHWSAQLERRRELGRELLDMAPKIDAATTLEQRLDLLNVNVADRAEIRPGAGMVLIIAGHCLEDSAAHRRDEGANGPLFNSVHLEIVITMSSTAKGRAAADKIMTDLFGNLGVKPKLQLVATTTPPTTGA
jgi:hypothetical protein